MPENELIFNNEDNLRPKEEKSSQPVIEQVLEVIENNPHLSAEIIKGIENKTSIARRYPALYDRATLTPLSSWDINTIQALPSEDREALDIPYNLNDPKVWAHENLPKDIPGGHSVKYRIPTLNELEEISKLSDVAEEVDLTEKFMFNGKTKYWKSRQSHEDTSQVVFKSWPLKGIQFSTEDQEGLVKQKYLVTGVADFEIDERFNEYPRNVRNVVIERVNLNPVIRLNQDGSFYIHIARHSEFEMRFTDITELPDIPKKFDKVFSFPSEQEYIAEKAHLDVQRLSYLKYWKPYENSKKPKSDAIKLENLGLTLTQMKRSLMEIQRKPKLDQNMKKVNRLEQLIIEAEEKIYYLKEHGVTLPAKPMYTLADDELWATYTQLKQEYEDKRKSAYEKYQSELMEYYWKDEEVFKDALKKSLADFFNKSIGSVVVL